MEFEANKILFEKLEEKSESVKDVEILKNHKLNATETKLSWSADELTYLVHGVSKYASNWQLLLRDYKTHFYESIEVVWMCNGNILNILKSYTKIFFVFSTKSIIIV